MALTCQVYDVDPTKLFAIPTDTFIRFRIIKQLKVISTLQALQNRLSYCLLGCLHRCVL